MKVSKNFWIGLGAIGLLAINVIILSSLRSHPNPLAEHLQKVQAKEMQQIRAGRRGIPLFILNEPFNLIGNLATHPIWTKILPLDREQSEVLTKFDKLLHQSRENAWIADSEYPAKDLESYQKYLTRSDARIAGAMRHAQKMVTLGLLTNPQAAIVTKQYLSSHRPFQNLYDENVQELLGFTKDQKEKLTLLGNEARSKNSNMKFVSMAMSPDQNVRDEAGASMVTMAQETDAAIKDVLTQDQLATWDRLRAQQALSAEPPQLPSLSSEDASRIKINDLSQTFQAIAERGEKLGLTADQKKLLKELEDVAREGVWWIRSGRILGVGDPGDIGKEQTEQILQRQSEFIKQAEQVALLGILNERQAEQVQAVIKKG